MTNANVPKLPGATSPPPPPNAQKPAGNTSLLLVAILIGVLAVALNIALINKVRTQADEGTFTVWELTKSVEPGDRIKIDRDLIPRAVPKVLERSYKGAITNRDDLINLAAQEQVAIAATSGTFVTYELLGLSEQGSDGPDKNRRWVSLIMDRASGPTIRKGDIVDVYAGLEGQTALTIIEGVKVVNLLRGNVCQIEVVPPEDEQIAQIIAAMDGEPFYLTKRNPGDAPRTIGVSTEAKERFGISKR